MPCQHFEPCRVFIKLYKAYQGANRRLLFSKRDRQNAAATSSNVWNIQKLSWRLNVATKVTCFTERHLNFV